MAAFVWNNLKQFGSWLFMDKETKKVDLFECLPQMLTPLVLICPSTPYRYMSLLCTVDRNAVSSFAYLCKFHPRHYKRNWKFPAKILSLCTPCYITHMPWAEKSYAPHVNRAMWHDNSESIMMHALHNARKRNAVCTGSTTSQAVQRFTQGCCDTTVIIKLVICVHSLKAHGRDIYSFQQMTPNQRET